MRLKAWISACLILTCINVIAQDSIQSTIVLIGDAGALTNGKHPVVEAAKRTVKMNEKTTILYLGDNLYKTGLPDDAMPNFDIAKAPLDSQIHITRGNTKTKVYFIPGNHDWYNSGVVGLKRQEEYVNEKLISTQGYIGRSWGCPAIPQKLHKAIINKIKDGTCLFIYSPDKKYLTRSKILNREESPFLAMR